MSRWRVEHGDSRERLRELADASIDAVVTDPPYEIGFMGRGWDASGIAYDVGLWREALRVLKPGGHLLAFGATRTYHRMACAIEDAGFEIRDSIHWMYGSGFPKSLDVSKAIDKAAGAERPVVGERRLTGTARIVGGQGGATSGLGASAYEGATLRDTIPITAPTTDDARTWLGWGTALKPAHEPIVVARKPLVGTVAANVLAHGVGGINVDGCRVGWAGPEDAAAAAASFAAGRANGTLKPSVSIGKESRDGTNTYHPDKLLGRWPPNVVFSHLPSCEAETCAEGCAVAELDAQSGGASRFFPAFRYQAKPARSERDQGLSGFMVQRAGGMTATVNGSMKTGLGNDRETIRANVHPTVKPVELMRWLVRLVTPPGGVVLDPFTGSGTTGIAAVLEDARFVGVELSEEYRKIAVARIEGAQMGRGGEQLDLF